MLAFYIGDWRLATAGDGGHTTAKGEQIGVRVRVEFQGVRALEPAGSRALTP